MLDFGFMILSRIGEFLIILPALLAAIVFHELAHGWVAWRLGDPTAKAAGRLSLNPLKHMDPIGTLVLFLTQAVGWAKPVPVNPTYFRNPRQDMMLVGLAGPVANFILAFGMAFLYRILPHFLSGMYPLLGPLTLDFGKIFSTMLYIGVQINIGLALFNLLPIPPLDGSRILAGILPSPLAYIYLRYEYLGFIFLVALVFTGLVGKIILPVIITLTRLFLGG